jgi:ubiquinone/menaquinone biosynthesis C-methylase UbiE
MSGGHLVTGGIAETQGEHFDRIAVEYDESLPAHVMAHLLRRRVRLATELQPSGRVLDVGCGTGVFLDALSGDRHERMGVDVSEEMLAVAAERGIATRRAGADDLPFSPESFDLVVSIACLHHLIDPRVVAGALREMARVVRPGGSVLVWDHNPLNPYWRVLMARVPQDTGDERLVPADEVVSGLRAAGLERIELRRMTFVPDFTPAAALPLAGRLEALLERLPGVRVLAGHNFVVARKPAA